MRTRIVISAVLVAAAGIVLVLKYQSLARLREQNQALQQEVGQLAGQAEERQRRSNLLAQASQPVAPQEKQLEDLNRLRGEVEALRRQTNELARLRAQNRQLRTVTDEPEDPAEAEFKNETQKRNNNLKVWGLDFYVYASKNNDHFPETWEQAFSVSQVRSRMQDPAEFDSYMNNLTNNFGIVYRGSARCMSNPGETILFRERQARRSPDGEWVKVYGFADGSTQIHSEPAEANFEAWENRRMAGTQ